MRRPPAIFHLSFSIFHFSFVIEYWHAFLFIDIAQNREYPQEIANDKSQNDK